MNRTFQVPDLAVTAILKSGCKLSICIDSNILIQTWIDEDNVPSLPPIIIDMTNDEAFDTFDLCNTLESYNHRDLADRIEHLAVLAKNRPDDDEDFDPEIEDAFNNHGQGDTE